jgi:hypothetical protein
MSLETAAAIVGIASGVNSLVGGGGGTSGSTTTTTKRTYAPFETRANDAANEITRGQWDYAKQFYSPLENELIAKSSANDEEQTYWRGHIAEHGTNRAFDGNNRDLMRQGVTMSGQQQQVMDRLRQLGVSQNRAAAQNTDRLQQYERNKNTLATLAGFGRSNLQEANAAAGAAAGMETQRNISGGYTDTSTSTTKSKSKSGSL